MLIDVFQWLRSVLSYTWIHCVFSVWKSYNCIHCKLRRARKKDLPSAAVRQAIQVLCIRFSGSIICYRGWHPGPQGKSSSPPVFVNKGLSEHSHISLFPWGLWLLLGCDRHSLLSLKRSLSGLFQKNVLTPERAEKCTWRKKTRWKLKKLWSQGIEGTLHFFLIRCSSVYIFNNDTHVTFMA